MYAVLNPIPPAYNMGVAYMGAPCYPDAPKELAPEIIE